MSLHLSRGDAVAVLVGIGYRNITKKKWDNEKLAKQLANLKNEDAIAPDLELDDQDADMTLRDVLSAIEDEIEIYVTDNGRAPELPAADGSVLTPMEDADLDDDDDGTMVGEEEAAEDAKAADDAAVVKAEAKAAKAKQEQKEGKVKAKTKAKEDKKGLVGVRPGITVAFMAGQTLKKHGMDVGLTPGVVEDFNKLRNKPDADTAESKGWLSAAWHSINGYRGET